VSPGMLEVSRANNPECEHFLGDMRSVRLGRLFDAVFIHDAIMYMTTEDDLRAALQTAFVHLKPGGLALVAPDFVRETFQPSTDHGGHDGEERALRYLEWSFDPDPGDTTVSAHYVYMLKDGSSVTVEHDLHTCGLFERDTWLRLFKETGFETRIVVDDYNRDLFVASIPP
jgi:SAM-dependent methyltransferase